jgi:hypothetical protein
VIKLVPEGVGAKLTLGDCYKGAQRLASAWSAYTVAEAAAERARQAVRKKKAHDEAAALEPQLSRLTIVVPITMRSVPGLEVRHNGVQIGSELWGIQVPVDGGKHLISVRATGKRAWEKVVDIQPAGARELVEVGILTDVQVVSTLVTTSPPLQVSAEQTSWNTQQTIALVAGVGGIAGAAIGSYFGLHSKAKRDESRSNGHCVNGNMCDAIGFTLLNDAIAAGNMSTGFFVAGGVLLGGGLVLLITAPSTPDAAHTTVALDPRGIMIHRSW